jgi:hypothetical protein
MKREGERLKSGDRDMGLFLSVVKYSTLFFSILAMVPNTM